MKVELIRTSDNKRLKLYGNGIYLEANDNLFPAKTLRTSLFNYADADGGQMVKQNYDSYTLPLNGFIEGKNDTERFRTVQSLASFFNKNNYYTVLFTLCDGTMMQLKNVWLSASPNFSMRSLQIRPMFSLELTAGDPYFYSYAEDEHGEIDYSNSIDIKKLDKVTEGVGYMYSQGGYIYYGGGYAYVSASTAIPNAYIDSIINVSPIWQVDGACENPSITNYTTNTKLTYTGVISQGQTLVVNCYTKQAFIGTANVTKNVSGEWLYLAPGNNQLEYDSKNDKDNNVSTLKWNGVIL